MPKLRVLDLFSGIGGFSLGLERAQLKGAEYDGFETVAFCEIEKFPRQVLAKHWPDVPCYEDVCTLTAERLAADGIGVDVITGGFPCQDISTAGERAGLGEGTRSGLWSEIVRLACELRPQFIIVENVANLLSGPSEKRGGWFGRILGDLAECGYDAEWENIPAATLGAPHLRERVWIIAYPNEIGRAFPILSPKHDPKGKWGDAKVRGKNWKFPEMGPPVPPLCNGRVDKPSFDGMDDGVPDFPHRLAACGNAVVPQIPELIGNAILQSLNNTGGGIPQKDAAA
tara:strand:- start:2801 stop:3655 length:855 start_codon:yes stop_codon:yes gene_type:complete